MTTLRRYLHEPVSALTHLFSALASLVGLVVLLALSGGGAGKTLSLAIYGASMVLLFSASSLFHGVRLPEGRRMWLNRLDHAAIFLLIAGTYTPIVYNLAPPEWRWSILLPVWMAAFAGMAFKLFSPRIHGLVNASIYPVMAWGGVVPILLATRLTPFVPLPGTMLLLLGGLVFMIGFVIYYRQRPNPWPGVFGHHEIWHLFVIGGCLFHYLFMLLYVALEVGG